MLLKFGLLLKDNTWQIIDLKYIFSKTCFTLKHENRSHKSCVPNLAYIKILFGHSTNLFPLDEIHLPLVFKAVIFDIEDYKCDYFQNHLTFSNHFHDFLFTKQVPKKQVGKASFVRFR